MLNTAAKRTYMSTKIAPDATAFLSSMMVDLRSDTVTRPSLKMRDAMANAICGDDIYKDCPTTNRFESEIAELLGKEAALLTSSGCQANLISQMIMAKNKGDAVILGHLSHILCYERGGISAVGSILPRVL